VIKKSSDVFFVDQGNSLAQGAIEWRLESDERRRHRSVVLACKWKLIPEAAIRAPQESQSRQVKIRPAAFKVGIRLEPGQRFGFHNFRHSLATFLVSRGPDVKTIQGLLRHAKVTTTLDLYSQAIDAAKLEAQEDIALAIRSSATAAD
jgi:integrase